MKKILTLSLTFVFVLGAVIVTAVQMSRSNETPVAHAAEVPLETLGTVDLTPALPEPITAAPEVAAVEGQFWMDRTSSTVLYACDENGEGCATEFAGTQLVCSQMTDAGAQTASGLWVDYSDEAATTQEGAGCVWGDVNRYEPVLVGEAGN